MKVRLAACVLAIAAPALLAGCASSSSSSTATGVGSGPSASAYPVTVKAGNGAVTIKARPARIVSLAPTATEDLYAVGAGRQVVAVDADSDYPSQAPVTKLSGLSPNVEAIAKYRPDLVIASQDTGGLSAGLKKLGIPVLIEPAAASLDDAYAFLSDNQAAAGGQSPAVVARRPGWAVIPAVKDHEIIGLNDDVASRWGPRLPQLVAQIAQAVEQAKA